GRWGATRPRSCTVRGRDRPFRAAYRNPSRIRRGSRTRLLRGPDAGGRGAAPDLLASRLRGLRGNPAPRVAAGVWTSRRCRRPGSGRRVGRELRGRTRAGAGPPRRPQPAPEAAPDAGALGRQVPGPTVRSLEVPGLPLD